MTIITVSCYAPVSQVLIFTKFSMAQDRKIVLLKFSKWKENHAHFQNPD